MVCVKSLYCPSRYLTALRNASDVTAFSSFFFGNVRILGILKSQSKNVGKVFSSCRSLFSFFSFSFIYLIFLLSLHEKGKTGREGKDQCWITIGERRGGM